MPTLRELYEQCTQEERDEIIILGLLCIQAREKFNKPNVRALSMSLPVAARSIPLSIVLNNDQSVMSVLSAD